MEDNDNTLSHTLPSVTRRRGFRVIGRGARGWCVEGNGGGGLGGVKSLSKDESNRKLQSPSPPCAF